jgi:hypothetical protein
LVSRPAVTNVVSTFNWRDGPSSLEEVMSSPPRLPLESPPGGEFKLGLLIAGHRTGQSTPCKPLTRLASRSVMRGSYSVAAR